MSTAAERVLAQIDTVAIGTHRERLRLLSDLGIVPVQPEELTLYPWQTEAVEQLRVNIRGGVKNQVLCAPTGSGKTICSAHLIQECQRLGKRALVICDRINLIDQTSAVLDRYGIPHGVIQAQHWRSRPWEHIQLASAQTLARRKWPKDLALIVVDECHTQYASVNERVERRECVTVGLSATPFAKGMGRVYDAVVNVRTTNQLIADRYLSPYTIFAASEPDMAGAKTSAGEWTDAEAEKRALPIIGDVVQEYLAKGQGKKFIAFGVNVRHCEEMQRQMMAAGIVCGLYTYRQGDEARAELLRDFHDPEQPMIGLISVAALAKGFDAPDVGCIIMARPLRSSLAEVIQIFGRGIRRNPQDLEKECVVLDHSGNMVRFWPQIQTFFEHGIHSLDDAKPWEKKQGERGEREPAKCPDCKHVHPPQPSCPACGFEYPRRPVLHEAGELSHFTGKIAGSGEDRQQVYSQLLAIARQRQYKSGWAAYQYKSHFGDWPRNLLLTELPPTKPVRQWVTQQLKTYRKGVRA